MVLQAQLPDLRGQCIVQRSAAGEQQACTRPLLHHLRKGLQQAGQVLVLDQTADEEHQRVECILQIMLAQQVHPCGIRFRHRHAVVHHVEMVQGPVHLPCRVFGPLA